MKTKQQDIPGREGPPPGGPEGPRQHFESTVRQTGEDEAARNAWARRPRQHFESTAKQTAEDEAIRHTWARGPARAPETVVPPILPLGCIPNRQGKTMEQIQVQCKAKLVERRSEATIQPAMLLASSYLGSKLDHVPPDKCLLRAIKHFNHLFGLRLCKSHDLQNYKA